MIEISRKSWHYRFVSFTKETPMYMIESDATLVAPMIFAYVLGGS